MREEIGDSSYKSEADAFASNINRNFNKRRNKHRRKGYFTDDSVIILSDKSQSDILLKRLEKLKEI